MTRLWWWVGFNAVVLSLLALDLGVFHRRAHRIGMREASLWSAFWISLSLTFGVLVYFALGRDAGVEFYTGYLIEYALSVDNIFVFVLIFSYFRIPPQYQHRVLFWGIVGALAFRGIMIGVGAALIARFDWVLYLFGAFLVYTGLRMARHDRTETYDLHANPTLRLVRRFLPVTSEYHGQKLVVRAAIDGRTRTVATPLFVALALVETTDIVFATDSIPAIFAITRDPFIVYTATICAVLGLRALYFLLAGMVDRFHYLQVALSAILVFIGGKMLLEDVYHVPTLLSLAVVVAVLGTAVVASLLRPGRAMPVVPPLARLASRQHHPEQRDQPVPEAHSRGNGDGDNR